MASPVIASSPLVTMTSTLTSPISPTFMPLYLHRSPSSSSLNTRQRSDFEDDDFTAYPALELPFASEPALESEQDPQLPALKKLRPNGAGEEGGSVTCAKGILARRSILDDPAKEGAPPTPPPPAPAPPVTAALPPLDLDYLSRPPLQPSWTASPLGMTPSEASSSATSLSASRPMSRRSSSGASSCCGSFKAVRFASGNGLGFSSVFTPSSGTASPRSREDPFAHWEEHVKQSNFEAARDVFEKEDFAGPVAAVVYLTHSREAYDRSPIVVDEAGCKLPPREKKAGERGWIKCGKRNGTLHRKEHSIDDVISDSIVKQCPTSTNCSGILRSHVSGTGRPLMASPQAVTGTSPLLKDIDLEQRPPRFEGHRIMDDTDDTTLSPVSAMQASSSESDKDGDECDEHSTGGMEYWNRVHALQTQSDHTCSSRSSSSASSPCTTPRSTSLLHPATLPIVGDEDRRDPEPATSRAETSDCHHNVCTDTATLLATLNTITKHSLTSSTVSSSSTTPLAKSPSAPSTSWPSTASTYLRPSPSKSNGTAPSHHVDHGDVDDDDDDDDEAGRHAHSKQQNDGDDVADVVDDGDDGEAQEDDQEEEEEEEEEEEDVEDVEDRRTRRKLGMCGLGKWSRGDVFTFDALGGF